MEGRFFQGSIIAWIIGIPFLIMSLLTMTDHRIKLLLINPNKFENGQELVNQTKYILKLMSKKSKIYFN